MMPAGQQIDPGTLQALKNISSSTEDQTALKQQMALAQQMRQPMPPSNEMAGKVAIRQSPLAYIGAGLNNAMAQHKEQDALSGMQAQAKQLRDARGRILDLETAQYNHANNPQANHPDTNAMLDP